MKLKTLKLITCAAIAALTLSVTACGGSDDAAKTADSAEVETVDNEEDEEEAAPEMEDEEEAAPEVEDETEDEADTAAEAEDKADATTTGTTLEDYFSDPTVMSLMEQQYAALSEQGMEASIDVKGNDFTIIIKITDGSLIDDTTGDQISASMDAMESQLVDSVKQFDEAVGEEGACTVTMRYLAPDGNVLAEKTCSAK